jgi:ATP-binding cassette subfamily B (MDR/TAP) protein 1
MSGIKAPHVSAESNISFQDVSFAYPSRRDVQVLDQVNMTFEAQKTTAIVGPSGSGKSTVVGLLERWYGLDDYEVPKQLKPRSSKPAIEAIEEKKVGAAAVAAGAPPIEGQILIGDVNLSKVDAKWWRSQIGLVQQEPFLFNDTIYSNVAYGLCGTGHESLPDAEKARMVEDACRQAFADEFITKLPQGYSTTVGESGIKLSGGQRQRIAIARAIIKKPPILILDEATSAIDVRTEKIVQAALDRASQGRTTIVIAHRLSTIKKANKIIVLRKGQVMEEGTHSELLKDEDGIYSSLVRAQNITMGAEEDRSDEEDSEEERLQLIKTMSLTGTGRGADHDGIMTQDGLLAGYTKMGFLRSFGTILGEQKFLWPQYVVAILSCCAAGAVFPLQAYMFAQLINSFTIINMDKLQATANHWALMLFVLACAMLFVYFVLAWSTHWIGSNVTRIYQQEYLDNVLRKRIAFFDAEGNSPGSISARIASDPEQIQQVLGAQMGMAYVSVFNLLGSLIISFYYGWKLSLVSTCVILPATLGAGFVRVRLELKFEEMNAKVFAKSSQFAVEAVSAFRTVTSLILEDTVVNRYDALMTEHVKTATYKSIWWTFAFALSNSIDMACQAFMLWYGGTLLASHEYNLIQYFVIFQAIVQGGMAAGIWFSFAPNIANATAGANRILSSRHSSPGIEHEHREALPSEKNPNIDFKDVFFSYKSRNLPVLTGLNITIMPGQFVALVGATGCGKSTTISLLERFYDSDKGAIMYGSQDIKDLNVPAYRANISLVAQESTLYEGTIKENVCLSVDETDATEETMYQACKASQIHDFITSLPDGYNTYLGPKGVSLSGGQRQRLALARALMRDPHVLLLDEATSSLDSESEKLVQEAIDKAAGEGKRTIIAVAHRLATIQKADVIFVLGSGKVLESGSHQELLKARGVYYSMVSLTYTVIIAMLTMT